MLCCQQLGAGHEINCSNRLQKGCLDSVKFIISSYFKAGEAICLNTKAKQ